MRITHTMVEPSIIKGCNADSIAFKFFYVLNFRTPHYKGYTIHKF